MDAGHFDRLVRSWTGISGGRRALLAVLATLPLLGGLLGLAGLDDEAGAHGRRKRRKARKKHRQGSSKRRRQRKRCQPRPRARTCRGKCGVVKNNCKKKVDCGPCPCDVTCTGSCCGDICVDLDTDSSNCGACGVTCLAGQTCQGGTCWIPCDKNLCDPTSEICVDGVCERCDVTCDTADHTCSGTELQTALDGGGTVHVCPGRYIGGFTLSQPSSPVTVIGAGQGGDERVDTILDGQSTKRVLLVPSGVTASLDRLRITGGWVKQDGGGVSNAGNLTMTNCTVTANTTSGAQGGGIFNHSSRTLTMTNCTVSKNTTTGTVGSCFGGGIAGAYGGTVTLTGCTISGNVAADGGGGIQNDGTLNVYECTVEKNRAETSDGGGIRDIGGTVTLDGGSVKGNFTDGVGGGLYTNGAGSVDITGTTFQNNDPDDCYNASTGSCYP